MTDINEIVGLGMALGTVKFGLVVMINYLRNLKHSKQSSRSS